MSHYEMRFSGTGGQGMMLMGDILAHASGILEHKEIVLLKSYGPEARGGACRSELIMDTHTINYPALSRPDFVLAMSQLACNSYTTDMDCENGILLVDSEMVKDIPVSVSHIYGLPLTRIAREVTGKAITANVVALGAISALCGSISGESVRAAILNRFPNKLHEINLKAFQAGVDAAKATRKKN